jgi:plastocyanin
MRRVFVLVVAAGLVIAACSSDGDEETASTTTAAIEQVTDQVQLEEYYATAAAVPLAESDGAVPPDAPVSAGGAPGFSRYVFRQTAEGAVVPSLVEGPLGEQTRCQDPDLPCSYNELQELHESGDPIPDGLDLTRDELGDLVGELETLQGVLDGYRDVDNACADGFFSDRTQTPNMGSHFTKSSHVADGVVDPAKPDILLYARVDGTDPEGQLGRCTADGWEGDELELVGSSFIVLNFQAGDEHPEGFAGGLDNWHIHYNLCRGAGSDAITPDRESCEALGGRFAPTLGWMIHAWADPEHDNQLGVFSMWNPSIWPVSDPEAVRGSNVVVPDDASADSYLPIANFAFGDLEVETGEEVVFGNSDSVPHTVTGESGDFDSGVFAPGERYATSFDDPGEYSFYCTLHPDMQGTITVE